MPLDKESLDHLIRLKENIEEILSEIGDIVPPGQFCTTMILRYCGTNSEIDDMIWTDDVHDDVIKSLERERDKNG